MPVIPDRRSVTRAPIPRDPGLRIPDQDAGLSQAISQFGMEGAKFFTRLEGLRVERETNAAYASAKSELTLAEEEIRQHRDPDTKDAEGDALYAQYEPQFNARGAAILDKHIAGLTGRSKERFSLLFEGRRNERSVFVRKTARKGAISREEAGFGESMLGTPAEFDDDGNETAPAQPGLIEQFTTSESAREKDEIARQIQDHVDAMVKAGIWSEKTGFEELQKILGGIASRETEEVKGRVAAMTDNMTRLMQEGAADMADGRPASQTDWQTKASTAVNMLTEQLNAQGADGQMLFTPEQRHDKKQAFIDDLYIAGMKGWYDGQVERGRPLGAMLDVLEGGGPQLSINGKRIRPTREMKEGVETYMNTISTRRHTLAERIRKLGDDATEEAQELQHARNIDAIFEGTITADELDVMRENGDISPDDFVSERKLIEAEGKDDAIDDNIDVVFNFNLKLNDGLLTKNEALDAYADRLIKKGTYDKFAAEIDSGPDDFAVREQRKALIENVSGIGAAGVIYTEDRPARVQITNRAVDEFNRRVRGADREDPLAVRLDIEKRALEVPLSVDGLLRPRFIVTLAGAEVKNANMLGQETVAATQAAFNRGEITQEEADREYENIENIRRIVGVTISLPKTTTERLKGGGVVVSVPPKVKVGSQ